MFNLLCNLSRSKDFVFYQNNFQGFMLFLPHLWLFKTIESSLLRVKGFCLFVYSVLQLCNFLYLPLKLFIFSEMDHKYCFTVTCDPINVWYFWQSYPQIKFLSLFDLQLNLGFSRGPVKHLCNIFSFTNIKACSSPGNTVVELITDHWFALISLLLGNLPDLLTFLNSLVTLFWIYMLCLQFDLQVQLTFL